MPSLRAAFVDDRFHQHDALHAARLALRAARRRVGDRGDAAPPHRFGLKHQRREAAGRVAVAAGAVRPAFDHREHVDRGDAAFFGETHLHAAVQRGTRAADRMLFFTADAHQHRRARLLGKQRGNDVGDRPRPFAP